MLLRGDTVLTNVEHFFTKNLWDFRRINACLHDYRCHQVNETIKRWLHENCRKPLKPQKKTKQTIKRNPSFSKETSDRTRKNKQIVNQQDISKLKNQRPHLPAILQQHHYCHRLDPIDHQPS
ncbi:hypothetical protein E1A91_D10G261800v1 [Gossypium mustelinum]|uniref:Uncharacterized protein n=4 Tax=Gossypium TaxID=3633 RepID=A0A5J5PYT3_GOSBA|nr:hypothetical protein ES319_D10G255600v1 [Gossypium barbadense]TYG51641.1 hypothetical protein ES288_D10G275400v1 [Gossypium darwinii]TYH51463.1 hypothetical protein ES332_D10G276600v1 [Gossypium tomentosum]TYI62656.1 hypothetical protein E1A91_D10G261800v1 [Gossypium mustelinum]